MWPQFIEVISKDSAVLEGGERPPLALGVRARVVQALLRQRRVARHVLLVVQQEPRRVWGDGDPLLRPEERVRRAHLALQLP